MKLEPQDFPLTAIGNRIYARRQSGAIATCWDEEMAAYIVALLNAEPQFVAIKRLELGLE